MFRLLIAPEVLFVVGMAYEVIIPLLRNRPLFPALRWFGRLCLHLLPKPTSADSLVDSSKQRLTAAGRRLRAAELDREAADREQRALDLEEEANRLREGEDR